MMLPITGGSEAHTRPIQYQWYSISCSPEVGIQRLASHGVDLVSLLDRGDGEDLDVWDDVELQHLQDLGPVAGAVCQGGHVEVVLRYVGIEAL